MSDVQSRTALSQIAPARLYNFFINKIDDKEISKTALGVYTMRLGGVAAAFLLQILVARMVGAESFGIFAFSWVLATCIGQFCCCGFNETASRFLPAYIVANDLKRARGFIQFSGFFVFTISSIVCLAGIALAVLLREYIPAPYFMPTLLGLTCAPLLCTTHLKENIAISRSLALRGLTPTYIVRPLLIIVFAAIMLYLGLSANADTIMAALLVASISTLILQTVLLKNPLRSQLSSGKAVTEVRLWLSASLPLLFAQGFFILATSLDVFVLSGIVSAQDVGIYFAAAKIVACVSFVQMAVGSAITRRLSEANQVADRAAFAKHFERGQAMMLWPTLVGCTILALASPLLLRLFGSEFVSGTPIVVVLALGIIIQAAAGPIQERMVVLNQQKAVSVIVAVSLIFNLAASIALTLFMGLIGTALASVLSIALRVSLMRKYAKTGPEAANIPSGQTGVAE